VFGQYRPLCITFTPQCTWDTEGGYNRVSSTGGIIEKLKREVEGSFFGTPTAITTARICNVFHVFPTLVLRVAVKLQRLNWS
jgi:hypothetical protein